MKAVGPTLVARHPIAVVAERTGLSQDVLRVWERRYGAVEPARGPGGQRRYTDADIERLTMLHAVTAAGRSIGQVATLPSDALAALAEEDRVARERRAFPAAASHDADGIITNALAFARALDGARLEEGLRRAVALMGVSAFLDGVAAPLLRRAGDEWHAGRMSPSQEHLLSSVLHDIIQATMRSFTADDSAPRIVVATLAGERHVIGAALAAAIAAMEGWRVIYLGADLPAGEVASAARSAGARVVAVSIVYVEDRQRVLDELRALRSQLPTEVSIIAGGAGAESLAADLAKMGVRTASNLDGWLVELRADAGADVA
jgi:DNA-binding transcriptional MerR regulator/methylmalonyl-CoA mutase cobalamin-binding subunit